MSMKRLYMKFGLKIPYEYITPESNPQIWNPDYALVHVILIHLFTIHNRS